MGLYVQYRIACLEIPLTQHTEGPDFDCLPSIITGTYLTFLLKIAMCMNVASGLAMDQHVLI